jgi:hypothetical protein
LCRKRNRQNDRVAIHFSVDNQEVDNKTIPREMEEATSLQFLGKAPSTPSKPQVTTPKLFLPNSYHEPESFSLLQTQVLAIVLGNLVTIVIIAVIYFNVVLFGHYGSELIYAVLLSEALFTSRMDMLQALKRYTSSSWSPRTWVFSILTSFRGLGILVVILSILAQWFGKLDEPIVIISTILLIFIILDRYALFIFRLHHYLVSDETLVSLVLVFVLVAVLGVFIGSFLVLALRDAASVVDASAIYMNEHVLKDPELRSKFNEALTNGRGHIDSISKSLQDQYQDTPYAPAVHLTSSFLANFTKRFDTPGEPITWSFTDWEPLRDEVLSVGFTALYNGTLSLKDTMRNAADGIYVSFAVLASITFAFFDFGFRATFFAGVLFFLVSNPKSVLQTIMESFLSVFASSKRTNSFSSQASMDGGLDADGAFALDAEDRERAQAFRNFEDELRHTFKAVFAVPVSLAAANAIATIIIFSILNVFGANVNASYFAALIALILTLIPVMSPFLSCVPWCIVSSVVHGRHWASVALIVGQYFSFNMIDNYLLSSFHSDLNSRGKGSFRSYLTGLSFFFGITSMGLHGIVLGPLFVSFFYTTVATVLAQYREVFVHSHKRSREN